MFLLGLALQLMVNQLELFHQAQYCGLQPDIWIKTKSTHCYELLRATMKYEVHVRKILSSMKTSLPSNQLVMTHSKRITFWRHIFMLFIRTILTNLE